MPISADSLLLTDRVAVVTGAGRGIGKATAIALAQLGAHVAVCDMDPDGLPGTVAEIESAGRRSCSAVIDVRDGAAVESFAEQVVGEFESIDILVNNAGGGFHAAFADVSGRGEAALVAENFSTVTNCVRSFVTAGHMGSGGSIINVTSVEAYHAAPGFAVYAAMKAAVQQLSQSLALELGSSQIRVNCVAPDMIPTPGDAALSEDASAMIEGLHPTPLQRMGTADECAAVICFLASDLASFVTGSSIPVDGGTVAAGAWKVRLDGGFGL